MLKAHKYRLLPTDNQKATLNGWMGACRFVYNLALEVKIIAWASGQKTISAFDLMKQLTELKNTEAQWLKDCPGQALESAITNLDKAYIGFFKGKGFPKFKKRTNAASITFRRGSSVVPGKIRLSKIGWVDFIEHRPIGEGEIRTVVVSKTAAGNYFVSILINDWKDLPEKRPIAENTTIGIDLGLKDFATLSDGHIIENPKYLHEQLRRLRIEQRKLAKRYNREREISEQSKGWHKQRLVVAKIHDKIANQRRDFLHKASSEAIRQYDTICVEDLNVSGMKQNKRLSKSISDVGWSEFIRQLEYKATWNGKNILTIDRFAPSSKTCSKCGYVLPELKLSERKWDCPACGIRHLRDHNAAKNIKDFGISANPAIALVFK